MTQENQGLLTSISQADLLPGRASFATFLLQWLCGMPCGSMITRAVYIVCGIHGKASAIAANSKFKGQTNHRHGLSDCYRRVLLRLRVPTTGAARQLFVTIRQGIRNQIKARVRLLLMRAHNFLRQHDLAQSWHAERSADI